MTLPDPTDTDASTAVSEGAGPTAGHTPATTDRGTAVEATTATTGDEAHSRTRRGIGRGLLALVTVLVFIYLVLPLFTDARHDVETVASVNWWMLLLAVGAVFLSLAAYTMLTMAALPGERGKRPIRFSTLFRIQLTVKAVTNVIPGGTATGSAVGYKLMTAGGLSGTDTGFALATVGIGSAVILNLILWLSLLVSIPRSGMQPVYAAVGLIGVVVLGLAGALIVLLVKGHGPLDRMVRSIARRIPKLDPDKVSQVLAEIVGHLRQLWARPEVVRRGVGWALANWLLEALALWICVAAFGFRLPVDSLLVAFGIANVLAAIPITPGGLGFVEVGLGSTLVGFGVPFQIVTVSVVAFRVAQFWLPVPAGAMAYVSLKIWPGTSTTTSTRERFGDLATGVFPTDRDQNQTLPAHPVDAPSPENVSPP